MADVTVEITDLSDTGSASGLPVSVVVSSGTGEVGPQGPAGPQGDPGPAGPQGDPGPAGATGADGASAYEVAVAGGFSGTEAEWLTSLVGAQGPQGDQGPQGPAGADGADGADGQGVPVGGTTGQVLAKASATDFDTEWVDQTGGGSGTVESVVAGTGISVDSTDPANPVVANTGATAAQGAKADTAIQPEDVATTDAAGVVELATNTEATTGTDTTRAVTPAGLKAAIDALIDGAPGALDTLNEIATQLATDESAVSALTTTVSGKLAKASNLSDVASASTALSNLGGAPSASPAFTGNPTAPTPTAGDNDTSIATTAFVTNAVAKQPEVLIIAYSDESTAITTGTAKVTFRMPFAMTVIAVRASLTTASTASGPHTVDINEAGTSILSTKLSIDDNEKTSTTAATAAVISDSSLADDAEITIDVDTAGTGAKGGKVYLIGTRT